jgi:hypothetical protein
MSLVLSKNMSIVEVGGSVESALKGDYTIDVKAIMSEAWKSTLQARTSINVAVLVTLLFGMLISFLLSSTVGGIEAVLNDPQAGMILKVIVTVFISPFLGGIEMLGVLHAVKVKTKSMQMFSFLKRANWVALCALMTSLVISVGFQLFIIPGIFLAVVLSVSLPLVIEKKMMPMKAIIISVKALRFKWLPILAIYSGLFFILTLSLLPAISMMDSEMAPIGFVIFFFTLSYQIPLFYNVKGILYREIFGISVVGEATSLEEQNTNTDNVEPIKNTKSKQTDKPDNDDTFTA